MARRCPAGNHALPLIASHPMPRAHRTRHMTGSSYI
jgi:hypothetical protein